MIEYNTPTTPAEKFVWEFNHSKDLYPPINIIPKLEIRFVDEGWGLYLLLSGKYDPQLLFHVKAEQSEIESIRNKLLDRVKPYPLSIVGNDIIIGNSMAQYYIKGSYDVYYDCDMNESVVTIEFTIQKREYGMMTFDLYKFEIGYKQFEFAGFDEYDYYIVKKDLMTNKQSLQVGRGNRTVY